MDCRRERIPGTRIPGVTRDENPRDRQSINERIPGTDNLSKKLHENPRDDENPRDRPSINERIPGTENPRDRQSIREVTKRIPRENPRDRQSIKEVTRPGRKGFQINAGDSQDLLWKRPSIRQLVCPRGDVPRNASGDFGFGKSAYLGSAWNSGGTIFFTVSMIRSSISGASCAGRP